MQAEVTSFYNLPVYTPQGRYLGVVEEVVLDLPNRRVGSILLARTSPKIVEGGHKVAVPYRWIAAIGDIIILNHFPERVAAQKRGRETEEPVAA